MVYILYIYTYIYHGPPKPTFLEVSMVNNLVFRWPLITSGQIIATSHEFSPPKGSGLEGRSPYFREIYRLVKYYNMARCMVKGVPNGS